MDTIFANESFALTATTFSEGERSASVDAAGQLTTAEGTVLDTRVPDGFPQLSSSCPMLDALYGIAIRDHQRLVIERDAYLYMLCNRFGRASKIPEGFLPDGSVFWAGYGFNTLLYTRDTAFSSWMGTACILPDVVRSHLQYLRRLRRTVGLKVSEKHAIPIDGIPTEDLGISEPELGRQYNTNCYTRRTDDIVWVPGLWEVFKTTQDESLLEYMLAEFDYFDTHFYRYFFDENDGLYRGQPTFIDVGGPCYPERGPSETILLKALSTNGLYVRSFDILHTIAARLGQTTLAAAFAARRDALADAIRRSFGSAGYPFYKYEDGSYSDRQETLGLAFLALFGILPADECASLLAAYPDGDFGRPLVWPFFGSKQIYHDNSTWPFADTLYALAEYTVADRQHAVRKTLAKLCRHSLRGDLNEVLNWHNGDFVGCPGYIWSDAAVLTLLLRMIAGMDMKDDGTVTFAPVLPQALGGRFDLSGLRIGGMTINLQVRGSGETVARCLIDGAEAEPTFAVPGTGEHAVEIHLR